MAGRAQHLHSPGRGALPICHTGTDSWGLCSIQRWEATQVRATHTHPQGLTQAVFAFTEVVGVGCVLDGVRYTNGQSFQPNCKYNCTCVDGAVGCTPLCLRVRPPRLWCSHPRQVSLPGRCCQQWVCDNDARRTRKTAQRHTGAFGGCRVLECAGRIGPRAGCRPLWSCHMDG